MKSEFAEFYAAYGGDFDKVLASLSLKSPSDINSEADNLITRQSFEIYCRAYPEFRIAPILAQFHKGELRVRLHWPLTAFAVGQYFFEQRARKKYGNEPAPEEVKDLLLQNAQLAEDLAKGLSRIRALSFRLPDHKAPFRRAHLEWLDARISLGIDRPFLGSSVGDDASQLLLSEQSRQHFCAQLGNLVVALREAGKYVDPALLKREKGPADEALPNFVLRCGEI